MPLDFNGSFTPGISGVTKTLEYPHNSQERMAVLIATALSTPSFFIPHSKPRTILLP